MGRYLILWELDKSHVPTDPKQRADGWAFLMEMVKQNIKKGLVKEWGMFVGELRGFDIVEGSEVEIGKMITHYVPFINFQVHPIATLSHVEEILKATSG